MTTRTPLDPARPRRSWILGAALLLALPLGLSGCQEGGASAPGVGQGLLAVDPLMPGRPFYHDFDEVELGDQLSHTFELRNADPVPVLVRRISPACVCTLGKVWCIDESGNRTDGSFLSEPVISVPVGAHLFVDIDLDTNHVSTKNAHKLAMVQLLCDSQSTPIVQFELHTLVRTPLQVTPDKVDMKEIPYSSGGRGTVDVVTAQRGSPVRVLGIGETSPGLEVEVAERMQTDETIWSATAFLHPGMQVGPYIGWFEVLVTDYDGQGEGRPVRVPVHAMVRPDVVLSPSPMAFSVFTPDEGAWSRTLVRALVPGERIRVENASVSGEHADDLRVQFEPTDPDATGRSPVWTLTLLAPPELEGESFQGTLRVELDHEELPELQAKYICRPR